MKALAAGTAALLMAAGAGAQNTITVVGQAGPRFEAERAWSPLRLFLHDLSSVDDPSDPFRGAMWGTSSNLTGFGGHQLGNTVQYQTHERQGWSAQASYGFGEVVGDLRANRVWGISIGLRRGIWEVRIAHQNRNTTDTTTVMPLGNIYDARNTMLAANVKLGPVVAFAGFGVNKGSGNLPIWIPNNPYSVSIATIPSNDSRIRMVGMAIPAGRVNWVASYLRKDDRDLANRDADQMAFGATYTFSKRTDGFAVLSRVRSRNGLTEGFGAGSNAFNIGLRHAF